MTNWVKYDDGSMTVTLSPKVAKMVEEIHAKLAKQHPYAQLLDMLESSVAVSSSPALKAKLEEARAKLNEKDYDYVVEAAIEATYEAGKEAGAL